MTYTVLKLPDEPIVIARVELPLEQTLCTARYMWSELNCQADQSGEPFHVIFDCSNFQPDFSDILLWIDERRTVPTCRYRSPNLRTVIVGENSMVALAVRKIGRQLGVELIHTITMDEALAYVHAEIAAYRATSQIA